MRKIQEDDIYRSIIGAMNAGYEIIDGKVNTGTFTDSDSYGTVLAKNSRGEYVTWQFHFLDDDVPTFYWGHYFGDYEAAFINFKKRGL